MKQFLDLRLHSSGPGGVRERSSRAFALTPVGRSDASHVLQLAERPVVPFEGHWLSISPRFYSSTSTRYGFVITRSELGGGERRRLLDRLGSQDQPYLIYKSLAAAPDFDLQVCDWADQEDPGRFMVERADYIMQPELELSQDGIHDGFRKVVFRVSGYEIDIFNHYSPTYY